MLKPRSSYNSFLAPNSSQWICLSCRSKSQLQCRRASRSSQPPKPSATPKPLPPKTPAKGEAPVLRPLSRPVGVDDPPKLGDNPAKDPRSWSERRNQYWDKDAHTERRRKLINDLKRPYFQNWKNMRHHKGKTFIAPVSLLRAEMAKYLPNMQGYTLADSWNYQDTTKALRGKISIVSVVSETWAEWQALSFVGKKENPELAALVDELKGKGLQKVWINIEEDTFKGILVYWCLPFARARTDREDWHRSFVVRKGVDIELKESFGMMNGKVGHVYLVDQDCKIRWVGNGDASDEERASLVRVARRLVEGGKGGVGKKSTARKVVEQGTEKPKTERTPPVEKKRPVAAVS